MEIALLGDDNPNVTAHILVVDDDAMLARALARLLDAWGYTTAIAHGGNQALVAVGESSFTLVITDLRMPEGDGMTLIKALAKLDQRPGVIALTGYSDFSAAEVCDAGADYCFQKPVRFQELKQAIETLLK